ncbi:ATP-binding protein [Umezawaea sp. Da 62-37]|uniref:sensor histidine kinase n=1 Tax=Umezawaea sp. Da 62-37 TaxID=3075927 RepID=UPI0028F71BC1|nr:ATP-binding protein [Umezawaea sp. Da 62-37]WNV85015.1 ATP-binding protein [Umezawaea sp. Da 62-37]
MLLIILAVGVVALGAVAYRGRVATRKVRRHLRLLRDGIQDIVDEHIPALYRSVDGSEVAVPQLADSTPRMWLAEVAAQLKGAGELTGEKLALAERRWTDAENSERQAISTVVRLQATVEACRVSLWNLVGLRVPALVAAFLDERVEIPRVPDIDIPTWCKYVDGVLQSAQSMASRHRRSTDEHHTAMVRQIRDLTHTNERLAEERALREEELLHLVKARLPAVIESAFDADVDDPGCLHSRLAGTGFEDLLEEVLTLVLSADLQAEFRADDRAKSVVQAVMRVVRAQLGELEVAITDMQNEHDAPAVLGGLLRIDHANSQMLRRSQAIAMVCGATSGTQRTDTTLSDVLRGAVSRIRDYPRIRIGSTAEGILVGHRVEQVVLAVAELLDNAARHSTGAAVHVSTQPAHNGISIIIDDAGIGMSPDAVERANDLLSGTRPVRIRSLGDPPRIGLAACSVLVAAHGFRVNLAATSPYGGMRAVLFLPRELLVPAAQARHGVPRPAVEQPPAQVDRAATSAPASVPPATTAHGLPIRPPRHAVLPAAPPAEAPLPHRDPEELKRSAAALGAWQQSFDVDRRTPHERNPS